MVYSLRSVLVQSAFIVFSGGVIWLIIPPEARGTATEGAKPRSQESIKKTEQFYQVLRGEKPKSD